MNDAELEAIRDLWNDIRTEQTEHTGGMDMVPVAIDLFDQKFSKLITVLKQTRVVNAALTEAFDAITAESALLQLEQIEAERTARCGSCNQHESVDRYRAQWQAVATTARRYKRERDAYKKAKAENDERFMLERDTAREDVRWLLSEFGSEHWRGCDDSGCYLCEGYDEINKRYTNERQTNGS